MKQTITTSIDNKEYAALEQIARDEDRSVASLVRRATREYLEKRGFNKPATRFIKPDTAEAAAVAGASK